MRLAAIDIGTNTVLLVIVECESPPYIHVIADIHAIARLGEGVDKHHKISVEAFERFERVMTSHMQSIGEYQVQHVKAFATSAMRDAENRSEIIEKIRDAFDIEIEVLSGNEEAEWTYRGSILGVNLDEGHIGTLDIGGGSTELSVGTAHQFDNGVSMNIGAVRITERFFRMLPPSEEDMNAARSLIQQELHAATNHVSTPQILVAVAGTPTSLAAMHLNLAAFDPHLVHGHHLSRNDVSRLVESIAKLSPEQLVAKYPAVNRARADILLAGSLILGETIDHLGIEEVIVSVHGVRYGIAIRELEHLFGISNTDWQLIT